MPSTRRVIMAQKYAPMDMKPACPRENWPVKPVIRFRLTARMMLMPMVTIVAK